MKSDWSRKFAPQPEIQDYFHSIAEKHDIKRHITYFSTVQGAEFDEATGTWVVRILDQKTGKLQKKRCRVLISAVGALSVPKECDIKGAENFKGKLFHSSQWDHSFDWADKEVVVVGMFDFPFASLNPLLQGALLTVLSRKRLQCYTIRSRHE